MSGTRKPAASEPDRRIVAPAAVTSKKHMASEFLLFLLAGGFAAIVNLVSRYLLTPVIGFGSSVFLAYLIGMVVAYILFRTLVFGRSSRSTASESARFVIVNLAAISLVWLVSMGLARGLFPAIGWVWHAEDIAHFIGICIPAISSYFGHSMYTFKKSAV